MSARLVIAPRRELDADSKKVIRSNRNHDYLNDFVKTLCSWGWPVFPLAPGQKTPLTKGSFKRASSDPSIALKLFSRATLNIGIATGFPGPIVLDIDGQIGFESLSDLRQKIKIPRTFTVRSRSGGQHLYFKAMPSTEVRCSVSRVAPGIDVRGAGGYIVAPTSFIPADHKHDAGWYEIIDTHIPVPIPECLLTALKLTTPFKRKELTDEDRERKRLGSPDTPRERALLTACLEHLSADCSYESWRNIVWAILSLGWSDVIDIAKRWSAAAPHRFDEKAFSDLVHHFDPRRADCPSFGSIIYAARAGGWNG
jgi:hypothetical protein